MNPVPKAAWALAALCVLFFAQWHVIDARPPRWDEGMYLLGGLSEYRLIHEQGVVGFARAYLTTNPGGGSLLPLLAQPGFFLFGPSAGAALVSFAVLWAIVVIAIFDLTRTFAARLLQAGDGNAAGLLAAFLFTAYPLTQYQSDVFLTEFPLVTSIIVVHAGALRYAVSGSARWAFVTGLAIACGFLAKVTFVVFVIGLPVFAIVRRWLDTRNRREFVLGAIALLGPPLATAAPYYVTNLGTLLATIKFLTSAHTASTFGLGGAWDLRQAAAFLIGLFHLYNFALSAFAAALAVTVLAITGGTRARVWLLVAVISFLLPLGIVALSNFKLERYAYPGFVMLFALAGVGLALPWRIALGRVLVVGLLVVPAIKLAVTNSVLPPGIAAGMVTATAPDPRDWHIPELVRRVSQESPGPAIAMLGGSAAFHAALLQFETELAGLPQRYSGFGWQAHPGATIDDMFAFINGSNADAILYKTPPYEPAFLGRFAPQVLAHIRNGFYREVDLILSQPDGSRFILFVRNQDRSE